MKLNINQKLLLYILSTSILIYALSVGYLSYRLVDFSYQSAMRYTDKVAEYVATTVSNELNKDMAVLRTYRDALHYYPQLPKDKREAMFANTARILIEENKTYRAFFYQMELNYLDSMYLKPFGRIRHLFFFREGRFITRIDTLNLEGDDYNSLYYKLKVNKKEDLTEPYYYSYTGKEEDNELMSSLIVPIIEDNRFCGLVGTDVVLDQFSEIVSKIQPFEDSYAFLVANNGKFVGIENPKLLNKSILKVFEKENKELDLLGKIASGKKFSFFKVDASGNKSYVSILPIKVGNSDKPWALGLVVPVNVVLQKSREDLAISLLVVLTGLVLLTVVIYIISQNISRPLSFATKTLEQVALGKFSSSDKITITTNDEIATMSRSINRLIDGLLRTVEFANEIARGNIDYEFTQLSEHDIMGKALLDMQKSLRQAREEEMKRKEEEARQNWATKGEALFGEILRTERDNIEDFSYNIISNLVKYIGADQGGLFIINEDEKTKQQYIDLAAAYAFDRRKILKKRIPMGVGLVGRCVQEAETIYMTNIPDGYMNISSGLGERKPKSLLLVPLKFNEEVYAVAELASLTEIEPYKREFVERIGNSIASTIATVKINVKTALLLEELKIQSEELASQEEEMRQNMEEMQTTQEELSKRVKNYEAILEAFNSFNMVAEYDPSGKIIDVNSNFLRFLNKSKNELIGKYQGVFATEERFIENFDEFWAKLRAGRVQRLIQKIRIQGKIKTLSEIYIPIKDDKGNVYKVMNIAVDVTNTEQQ